jgi:hypothetical protein
MLENQHCYLPERQTLVCVCGTLPTAVKVLMSDKFLKGHKTNAKKILLADNQAFPPESILSRQFYFTS